MKKIIYERKVYESVDDGSLSWVISENSTESKVHAAKVSGIVLTLFT